MAADTPWIVKSIRKDKRMELGHFWKRYDSHSRCESDDNVNVAHNDCRKAPRFLDTSPLFAHDLARFSLFRVVHAGCTALESTRLNNCYDQPSIENIAA